MFQFLLRIVVETPKLENPSSLSLEALHDALHWTPHRLVPNKDCATEQDDFFGQFKNDGDSTGVYNYVGAGCAMFFKPNLVTSKIQKYAELGDSSLVDIGHSYSDRR